MRKLILLALAVPSLAWATEPQGDPKAQLQAAQARIAQLEAQVRQDAYLLANVAYERDQCLQGTSQQAVQIDALKVAISKSAPEPSKKSGESSSIG